MRDEELIMVLENNDFQLQTYLKVLHLNTIKSHNLSTIKSICCLTKIDINQKHM